MRVLTALVAGILFGLGLIISGMTNPQKVLNFLDFAGTWDPSLAFVMGAAVLVGTAGYHIAFAWQRPVLAPRFDLPEATGVDPRLLAGAGIFGIGWGLGGFCPGPAITSLPLAAQGTLIFVPAMLAGMWLGRSIAPIGRRPGRTVSGTP